ncbi:MAG: 50S ribosomal protein L22 [Candidatus Acidiferrales bacterium]
MPRKKPTSTGKKAAGGGKGRDAAQPPRTSRLLRRRKPEAPVSAAPVEARALARFVRISPQKARLVMDLIRGQAAGAALGVLRFTKRRAAGPIEKVLRSAIANAEQKSETVDVDRLYVKYAVVNEGPRWKRVRPAPFGRAFTYQRRTSHIEIAVAERVAARTAVAPASAAPAPAAG